MKQLAIAMMMVVGSALAGAQPAPAPAPAPAPKAAPAAAPKKAPASPKAPAPQDPYAAPAGKAGTGTGTGTGTGAPAAPAPAPQDPYAPAVPSRVGLADINVVQGLLAVQQLDGWLLYDRDGSNPIAVRLVAPDGHPQRAWFYMIPARGEPVALVHTSEARNFEHLKGRKLVYLGYRDLAKQLATLLKGMKSIALEYSPKAAVPNVSRVDGGTLEVIRGAGVNVRSSDTLVQYTKAIWGDPGRTAHFIAVHHLTELRKEALALVAKRVQAHSPVTEYEVQQQIMHGMQIRGLVGQPPVVAAGVNTADPYYVPTAAKTAEINQGDLLVISIAVKVDKPEGIYAAQTWCAMVDRTVPDRIHQAFSTVALARDQAIVLVKDRMTKHRPVSGAEVDQATRALIKKAGLVDQVMHRTGHSIDSDLQGGGADLDDFEVKDTRVLVPGTGFTVGPGVYFPGQFGVRSEVSVYLAPNGPEVTTPAEDEVEALLR